MRRVPGWIRLAGIALELTALAYIGYVVMGRSERSKPRYLGRPSIPQDDTGAAARDTNADARDTNAVGPDATATATEPAREERVAKPMEFIRESADEGTRFYRALDETGEVLAGFYADGRVRLADGRHRFAGMLQSGRADLLEIDNKQWSELFVRTTPTGRMQLELRGGPYDARVLTCETLKS